MLEEKRQGLAYGWDTGKGGPQRGRRYVRKSREVLRRGGKTLRSRSLGERAQASTKSSVVGR